MQWKKLFASNECKSLESKYNIWTQIDFVGSPAITPRIVILEFNYEFVDLILQYFRQLHNKPVKQTSKSIDNNNNEIWMRSHLKINLKPQNSMYDEFRDYSPFRKYRVKKEKNSSNESVNISNLVLNQFQWPYELNLNKINKRLTGVLVYRMDGMKSKLFDKLEIKQSELSIELPSRIGNVTLKTKFRFDAMERKLSASVETNWSKDVSDEIKLMIKSLFDSLKLNFKEMEANALPNVRSIANVTVVTSEMFGKALKILDTMPVKIGMSNENPWVVLALLADACDISISVAL